jgi:uncharacterized membrane protein
MWNKVLRSTLAVALIIGVSNLAVAQYGGGGGGTGGGMPGSPTYNPSRSYSNKGAIIGGVAVCGAGVCWWPAVLETSQSSQAARLPDR